MRKKFFYSLKMALPTTLKSAAWLLKLMIPISLGVTLLQHFGILQWIAGFLDPIFQFLGLPGESAIIFLSGATAGTYAGVAAMMSIHLTMRQATILGIMMGLCHALPMECAINKKTGSSFWKMGIIRIVMAFTCALFLNLIMPEMNDAYAYLGAEANSTFGEVMLTWVCSQVKVSLIVFAIIYTLMVIQRLIEVYNLLPTLSKFLAPLMVIFGLPKQSAYMWLVGNVLGISYGSAVMVELQEKKLITQEDANDVNYHLIMNHSMFEDTIVFASTGISAIWMLSSRMVLAIIVVWVRRIIRMIITR